jgi:hypothetical protein
MTDDFDDETGLYEDSHTECCQKCGTNLRISYEVGPEHGGWNEPNIPECIECHAPLGEVKSFSTPCVERE